MAVKPLLSRSTTGDLNSPPSYSRAHEQPRKPLRGSSPSAGGGRDATRHIAPTSESDERA
eukprot:132865-Prorocentrum_minimum.AAC.1